MGEGDLIVPKVHGVDEWLATIGGPHVAVRKLSHVPHDLVHDLGQLDGVSGRAAATAVGTATAGAVSNVALVVSAVKVDTVPATRGS